LSLLEGRTDASAPTAFDPEGRWRVHPRVALRPESFGALAYHYDTRRLIFLKSPTLVELVSSLDRYPSAAAAIEAIVPAAERKKYSSALARLAASEVIDAG
jgi:mycofactocin biosynthesis protein MftB